VTWRKSVPRGLRRGEELVVEVPCRILDSTGTSLPDAGTPVIVGVSNERILAWDVARLSTQAGKLLGTVSRRRVERAAVQRAGPQTRVRLDFEEEAIVIIEARREHHPEQVAWALSSDAIQVEQ
jgi:enoyl-[acyl-carrier-protein] reductase (NADH)